MAATTDKVCALFNDAAIENQQLSFIFDRIADGFRARAREEREKALKDMKDGSHNPGGWDDVFAYGHVADTLRLLAKLCENHNM